MRGSTFKNNFTSGELTPVMYGRTELEPYQKGLADCQNMRVLKHGGATRREGSIHVGAVKDSTKTVRLIPFVFSNEQSYVIELGDQYMRFWRDAGLIYSTTEEVVNGTFDSDISSWTDASLITGSVSWDPQKKAMRVNGVAGDTAVAWQQLTGVATGVEHRLTIRLDREDADTTHFVYMGPSLGSTGLLPVTHLHRGMNVITVTPGTATVYLHIAALNANGDVVGTVDDVSFQATNVVHEVVHPYTEGELFDVMYAQSNDKMWLVHQKYFPKVLTRTSITTFSIADAAIQDGPFNPLNTRFATPTAIFNAATYTRLSAGQVTSSGVPLTFTAASVGAYILIHDPADLTQFGIAEITSIITAFAANVIFRTDIPAGLQAIASPYWAMSVFGPNYLTQDFPGTVAFHDQRLFYAGSPTYRQGMWGSDVGDFDTFTYGTDDDMHVNFTLSSTKMSEIVLLSNKYDLIVGTISNEFAVNGGGLDDPITPSNVKARPHTSHGSRRVMPEELDDLVALVQRSGHKLIGLSTDPASRMMQGADMTILSEHLFNDKQIKQMAYQEERDGTLWVVTLEGDLRAMTYDSDQNILAWHRHDTGAEGEYESVVCIPRLDADQTWMVVKREINGSTVRYIERFDEHDWRKDNDPHYVDCGIMVRITGTATVSGLDHLEGETVIAYASGQNLGEFTVSSGSITLPEDTFTDVHVGLNFTSKLKELPKAIDTPDGSGHTRSKHDAKIDLRLYRTQGIKVNGDIRNLPRDASVTKPELFSGIIESGGLGWDKDAQNEIESIGANPLTVLAIRTTTNVGQR